MKINKKNNKEKKAFAVTALLIIALVAVGYFAFLSWREKPTVIDTSNTNLFDITTLNQNIVRNIKRPALEKSEPDHISIPDKNIAAPIIYITDDQNNEEGYQEALAKGVVHYPGTALPGEPGNPYIFGHSSDYFWKSGDYKEIFKPLVDIELDTKIQITDHEGNLYIYNIIETKIVGPKETSVLNQYNRERSILTLQTSWPIGTALKRYIVIAELDELASFGPEE